MTDAAFEALWKSVVDRWDDQRAHGAFLDYCQATDQLAQGAACYRAMISDRDRSGAAERRLKSIAAIAMGKLEASRWRAPIAHRRPSTLILAAVLGLAAVAIFSYFLLPR